VVVEAVMDNTWWRWAPGGVAVVAKGERVAADAARGVLEELVAW
jgi:hypothetical protein